VKTKRSVGRPPQVARDLNHYSSLVLECENDALSDAQFNAANEAKKEFKQAQDKINEMIKNQTVINKTLPLLLKINFSCNFQDLVPV